MAYETKFANFIRHGRSGSFDLRLADLGVLQRKFDLQPRNLAGSIADNALADGLADLNQYLPKELSVNIKGVDFSDIKAELDAAITTRITEIGLPVDQNDPILKAAIQRAATQVSARLQQAGMGLTEFIWRSQDDGKVRPEHQAHDDQTFSWSAPPEDGTPGQAYGCRCSAEPVFVLEDLPDGATCEKLTAEKMRTVFPKATDEKLLAFAQELDAVIDVGKLDSPERLAHFLGQASVEMGARARAREDFSYSVEALLGLPYYQEHPDEAEADGYIKDENGNTIQQPNEEAIANNKYPDANGNNAPGDGWRFAGRGLFHTTGRYNYDRAARLHQKIFGEFVDFVAHPELLEKPKYAVRSAIIYWLDKDFPTIADQGTTSDIADQITKVINKYTDTYEKRAAGVDALASSGVFDNVCRFSTTQPSFDKK